MALQAVEISKNIADLEVDGLKILRLGETPNEVTQRDCPIVIPAPIFVSNLRVERVDQSRFAVDIFYDLNYRLFVAKTGAGRGQFEIEELWVTSLMRFLDAALANHNLASAVDMEPKNVYNYGVVLDPSDNEFVGAEIALEVQEFK